MRSGLLAAGVALAAGLAPGGVRAEVHPGELAGPLPWHEPSPLARLFLQLPFEGPATVAPGALRGEAHLVYSNSLLVARNEKVALDVHVETAQLTAVLRRGLRDGVELQLAVPALLDTGGFLDRPIELAEGAFGAANPQRAGRKRDVAIFRLVRPDGRGIDREGPDAGMGDAWAGAKVELASERGLRPALSLRAAVKVPTGRAPFGSGSVDVGGSLLAGWSGARLGVRAELDVAAPTADLRAARIRTRPYGAVQAGLGWEATGRLTLLAQASGHLSPLGGTGLGQVDSPTFYLLAGAGIALPAALELTAGVAENVFSPYRGADVALVVGLGRRRSPAVAAAARADPRRETEPRGRHAAPTPGSADMSTTTVETAPQPRVVVFTTPTCSWCRRAKQYLQEKKVRFKEVDVSRDESAARDLVRMTGQMGVPVILVGSRPIVGFDRAQLDRLLNLA